MPFVYSDRYRCEFGDHIFPIEKYTLIKQKLLENGIAENSFFEPIEATKEQLKLVHPPDYLDDLDNLRWTTRTMFSELPLNEAVVHLFYLAAGGTVLAIDIALKEKWAMHLGGGFHHAFADKAEGFCYINDLAIGAKDYLQRHPNNNVLIVDLDLHQGNGTAKIFENSTTVFTFSMHEEGIYPIKEKSSLDIALHVGTADELYLKKLEDGFSQIKNAFAPDLILYQAGADPYYDDQLGHLALTKQGLRDRDRMVAKFAKECDVPLVTTLGGGYAARTSDTVDIHVGTCEVLLEEYSKVRN